MQALPMPLTRDLVLIGGGHTHALVLRKWAMTPLPGARLTVINPGPTAPYSGMLPGFVAGHYDRDALDIDLVQLARFAGARLILQPACGIDPANRLVLFENRPPAAFDIASVDVGITSDMPALPGFAEHAVPAKPLGPFTQRWDAYRSGDGHARVAVIGAGVAGAELAMAMAHALQSRGRATQVTLLDRNQAFDGLHPKTQHALRQALARQNVTLIENASVSEVCKDGVLLTDDTLIEADFVVGAAGARPHDWIATSGLALENGYIAVDETLRSSDPAIFAVGDCAYMTAWPRPKAGVYAVRQAPILLENLRNSLMENGRLRRYRPQDDYLKLISLGRKSALADRVGLRAAGGLIWRWKDHIDRKFMAKFRDFQPMPQPALPRFHAAGMRDALGENPACGGCGSKIGSHALRRALAPSDMDSIRDDAAVLEFGGVRQVLSTDHLRSLTDDPSVMARIAAIHALGDIWAMGAQPQAATATLILPRVSPMLAERILSEIMETARHTMQEAGAEIVGGHSSMGMELTIGFTVTGLAQDRAITLAGAKPGDALVLTKPIGTGVVMAAEMQTKARGDWVRAALTSMTTPQIEAAHALRHANAMTDVTGFGLAGHLQNICDASGTGAIVDRACVPLLPGAMALSKNGIRSTLFPENRLALPGLPDDPLTDLLFDPQTAGGLLAAVPGDAENLVAALTEKGVSAAVIGRMTDRSGQLEIR